MKKILFSGDSWAAGCDYLNDSYRPLKDFFPEYDFDNVAKPGNSNLSSAEHLRTALSGNKYDYVFWVQTDPMRDVPGLISSTGAYENTTLTPAGINLLSTVPLLTLMNELLDAAYNHLNEVAIENSTKIYCIGGCSMLHPRIGRFSNLVFFIPSIIKLLMPGYEDSIITNTYWISKMAEHAEKNEINKIFNENLHIAVNAYHPKERKIFSSKPYFDTDGHHPNSLGTAKWAERCKQFIGQ